MSFFLLLQSVLDFKAPAFDFCLKHYVLCCGFQTVLQLYKNLFPCLLETVKCFLKAISSFVRATEFKILLWILQCAFFNNYEKGFSY